MVDLPEIQKGLSYYALDGSRWRNAQARSGSWWLTNEHGIKCRFDRQGRRWNGFAFGSTLNDLKLSTGHVFLEISKTEQPAERITDEVVRIASLAGLKAKPNLEEFTRAILTAGLAQVELVDNSLTNEVDRLQADLDSALHFIATREPQSRYVWEASHPDIPLPEVPETNLENESGPEIRPESKAEVQSDLLAERIITGLLVHAFENDADIERVLRPFEKLIAGFLRAKV